jgi:hypothetical protein
MPRFRRNTIAIACEQCRIKCCAMNAVSAIGDLTKEPLSVALR